MLKKILATLVLSLVAVVVAAEDMVIADIRVEGLQRIPANTVFASLPFNIKDRTSPEGIREAIAVLYRTGNFSHVEIGRDGDVLVITVEERPAIAEIGIEGNKAIKKEDLLDGLKKAGLAEGLVFKRATLEGIRQELQRQYVSQGRYDAGIVTEVRALPGNRVSLQIDVDEGTVAKIKHLNIVGNQRFPSEKLLNLFEMQATGLLSWATSDDKYARERLRGDLERLESFYRDQGYLKFSIDSTQVALSPEKDAVFVTVNITEGEIYHVSDVKLSGELVFPEEVMRKLVLLKPSDTYSQKRVTGTEEMLSRLLGNDGYTDARVKSYPQVNEESHTVELTFFVDPGMRTYVNRIEFFGNTVTKDEVLRREMRQMEGSRASGDKIEQSRVRLERLGFFKTVEHEMVKVPGSDDLVDIVFSVEEQHSGSIGASVGFSDGSGLVLSANVQQNNFMGTGEKVAFDITKNDYQTKYSFSFTNPYYTIDGVSRGFSLFYKETDFDKLGVAEYSTNTYGGSLTFGYPVSETARIGFGMGYSHIEIETGPYAPQEVIASPSSQGYDYYYKYMLVDDNLVMLDFLPYDVDLLPDGIESAFTEAAPGFVDRHGNIYDSYSLNLSLQDSKLNRGLMPDRGYSQGVSLEIGLPETDLEYFKMVYSGQYFFPLREEVSVRLHGEFGYGDGYGDTEELPFFENFFSGGFGSVRGYEQSSLGPRGTPAQFYVPDQGLLGKTGYVYDTVSRKFLVQDLTTRPDTFGGNMLVEAGAELIFPLWFIEDRRSLRTVLFLDAGNVFDSSCGERQQLCYDFDPQELRAAYGFGLTWISAMGPLTFSIARPINESSEDKPKFFQFSIGTGF